MTLVVVCGEKFKMMALKRDMAMGHYITIAGNVKLGSFSLVTFDLECHMRSL